MSVLVVIICLFQLTCKKESVDVKATCETDVKFINSYIQSISDILNYCLFDEQDVSKAFKAFVNLEVLTNGRRDLDSLGVIFYESSVLKDSIESRTDYWLSWLEKNRCYNTKNAHKEFEKVHLLYPPKNYDDKQILSELRLKYQPLITTKGLSEEEMDSIIIAKDYQAYLERLPGW